MHYAFSTSLLRPMPGTNRGAQFPSQRVILIVTILLRSSSRAVCYILPCKKVNSHLDLNLHVESMITQTQPVITILLDSHVV